MTTIRIEAASINFTMADGSAYTVRLYSHDLPMTLTLTNHDTPRQLPDILVIDRAVTVAIDAGSYAIAPR